MRRTRNLRSGSGLVRPSGSRSESLLGLLCFGDEIGHAGEAVAPQLLVSVEQAAHHAQPVRVGADDLASSIAVLADQARPLEDRDVLLHRGEAHGLVPGPLGDYLFAV